MRKNISERMLKTMKKPNAPRDGTRERGAVAKAKPQKLLVKLVGLILVLSSL